MINEKEIDEVIRSEVGAIQTYVNRDTYNYRVLTTMLEELHSFMS